MALKGHSKVQQIPLFFIPTFNLIQAVVAGEVFKKTSKQTNKKNQKPSTYHVRLLVLKLIFSKGSKTFISGFCLLITPLLRFNYQTLKTIFLLHIVSNSIDAQTVKSEIKSHR